MRLGSGQYPQGSWKGDREEPTHSRGQALRGQDSRRLCPQGGAGDRKVRGARRKGGGGTRGGKEEALREQRHPLIYLEAQKPSWASAPVMAPHNWLDTEEVQSFNKPALRGQIGAPQASFRTRLTKWEGRARRVRGPGRRWGHTTSYCSTWGRGALEVTTVGGRGSAGSQGTHPHALGGGPSQALVGRCGDQTLRSGIRTTEHSPRVGPADSARSQPFQEHTTCSQIVPSPSGTQDHTCPEAGRWGRGRLAGTFHLN